MKKYSYLTYGSQNGVFVREHHSFGYKVLEVVPSERAARELIEQLVLEDANDIEF